MSTAAATLPGIARGLRELRLVRCKVGEQHVDAFAKLSRLVTLDLGQLSIPSALPRLATHENLYGLTIGQPSEASLSAVAPSPSLRHLDLGHVSLSAAAGEALGAWPLRSLAMPSNADLSGQSGAYLGDDGVIGLGKNRELEWLNVNAQRVTAKGLAALAALPRLRWLYAANNALGPARLGQSAFPSLRTAHLYRAGLEPGDAAWLAVLPAIESLHLWDIGLDAAAADVLKRLVRLFDLDVSGNPIEAAKVEELRAALSRTRVTGGAAQTSFALH